MTTDKLYYNEPAMYTFEAKAISYEAYQSQPSIVLNQTGFYPESGGQLGDRGCVVVENNRIPIIDTQINKDGIIHHLIDNAVFFNIENKIMNCYVDTEWRLNQSRMHTAQHILSHVLMNLIKAETIATRQYGHYFTIDLAIPKIDKSFIRTAENLVNNALFSNLQIRVLYPNPEELLSLPLKQQPKVKNNIRIIDIENIGMTPCGGTHCTSTCQIGILKIVNSVSHRGFVRLTSLVSLDAVYDYQNKDLIVFELASLLSCDSNNIIDLLKNKCAELNSHKERLKSRCQELIPLLANELHNKNPVNNNKITPILVKRSNDDISFIRELSSALISRDDVLAIVATRANKDWQFIVEHGQRVNIDIGKKLKQILSSFNGKGGGNAKRGEGRIEEGVDWSVFVSTLLE